MYTLLSYPLGADSPVHPALLDVKTRIRNRIPYDGYETHIICTENHAGTHVDAPAHYLEGGRRIIDYGIDELVFENPGLFDVAAEPGSPVGPGDIELEDEHDIILIRTGYGSMRGTEAYLQDNPWISPELIDGIRRDYHGIRAIGIDCISISTPSRPYEGKMAHLNAFIEGDDYGDPLLIIEDMKLEGVTGEIERVLVVPWMVESVDSAPCTVIAEMRGP